MRPSEVLFFGAKNGTCTLSVGKHHLGFESVSVDVIGRSSNVSIGRGGIMRLQDFAGYHPGVRSKSLNISLRDEGLGFIVIKVLCKALNPSEYGSMPFDKGTMAKGRVFCLCLSSKNSRIELEMEKDFIAPIPGRLPILDDKEKLSVVVGNIQYTIDKDVHKTKEAQELRIVDVDAICSFIAGIIDEDELSAAAMEVLNISTERDEWEREKKVLEGKIESLLERNRDLDRDIKQLGFNKKADTERHNKMVVALNSNTDKLAEKCERVRLILTDKTCFFRWFKTRKNILGIL